MSLKKASYAQEVLCNLWLNLFPLEFHLTCWFAKICVVLQIFSISLTKTNFPHILTEWEFSLMLPGLFH